MDICCFLLCSVASFMCFFKKKKLCVMSELFYEQCIRKIKHHSKQQTQQQQQQHHQTEELLSSFISSDLDRFHSKYKSNYSVCVSSQDYDVLSDHSADTLLQTKMKSDCFDIWCNYATSIEQSTLYRLSYGPALSQFMKAAKQQHKTEPSSIATNELFRKYMFYLQTWDKLIHNVRQTFFLSSNSHSTFSIYNVDHHINSIYYDKLIELFYTNCGCLYDNSSIPASSAIIRRHPKKNIAASSKADLLCYVEPFGVHSILSPSADSLSFNCCYHHHQSINSASHNNHHTCVRIGYFIVPKEKLASRMKVKLYDQSYQQQQHNKWVHFFLKHETCVLKMNIKALVESVAIYTQQQIDESIRYNTKQPSSYNDDTSDDTSDDNDIMINSELLHSLDRRTFFFGNLS